MKSLAKKPKSFKVFEKDLDQKSTKQFSKKNLLAIDTEAMGLIHGRDRLCLVQICDDENNVACIKIQQDQNFAPNLKFRRKCSKMCPKIENLPKLLS